MGYQNPIIREADIILQIFIGQDVPVLDGYLFVLKYYLFIGFVFSMLKNDYSSLFLK